MEETKNWLRWWIWHRPRQEPCAGPPRECRVREYITINYHTYATFRDFLKLKNMKRSIRRQRVFQGRLLPSLSYVAYALPTTYVGCCSPVPIYRVLIVVLPELVVLATVLSCWKFQNTQSVCNHCHKSSTNCFWLSLFCRLLFSFVRLHATVYEVMPILFSFVRFHVTVYKSNGESQLVWWTSWCSKWPRGLLLVLTQQAPS